MAVLVYVSIWPDGASSEILGIYSTHDLALARCRTEADTRGLDPERYPMVVQERKVDE